MIKCFNCLTPRNLTLPLILAAAVCSTTASADDQHPAIGSKYWLKAGLFYPDYNFSARVDGTADGSQVGQSGEIDLDARLDLSDRNAVFSAEAGWAFSKKWLFTAQYFDVSRSGSGTVSEDIEWEDVVYEVGADIGAGTNTSITRLFVAYKFFHDGPHDLQIGAGVHWLKVSAYIEGQARIDDMTTEFRRRDASSSAPLPNLGALYSYSPSKKWIFSVRTDWLAASIGEYDGRILNLMSGINYAFTEHVGVGLNYQYFRLDVGINSDNWEGHVDATYSGPVLYLSGYW